MSATSIDSLRKYSINISVNETIDQLNQQLLHLHDNTETHFSKRRKLLLQLERKNNQCRRLIDRSDLDNQKKLTINNNIIRSIKKKIIEEDRQQRQQRMDEQEENNNWSLAAITAMVGTVFAGVIGIATYIMMMLAESKERKI